MKRYLLLLICCLICTGLLGCKSLDWNKTELESEAVAEDAPWWKQDDLPPVKTPTKVVAFWANSVFNEAGAPPIRGLGGRVYFYDNKHQTVRVDGKLSVFIYDDTDENAREQQEATKQITFTAEEVASKYSPTEFGPSYSFWLPWDKVGGERAQLSVIPVFTAADGQMLHGEQARCLLPGRTPKVLAKEGSGQSGGVVAASFEMGDGDDRKKSPALEFTTTTIKVPQAVQRRLRTPSKPRVQRIRTRQSNTELNPRVSDLPRSTSPRAALKKPNAFANNRKPFDANFGRGTLLEPVSAKNVNQREFAEPTESQQPSADFLHDPRQAQALQSAQQASVPAPSVLDRARSLFDR